MSLFTVPRHGFLTKTSSHYGGQADTYLESSRRSTIVDARLGSKYTSGINHEVPLIFHNSEILIYLRTMNIRQVAENGATWGNLVPKTKNYKKNNILLIFSLEFCLSFEIASGSLHFLLLRTLRTISYKLEYF